MSGGGAGLDGGCEYLVRGRSEGEVPAVGLGGVAHGLGQRVEVEGECGEGFEKRRIALGDRARQNVTGRGRFRRFARGHGGGPVQCVDGVFG